MNQIIVSFLDCYNTIFDERVPAKTQKLVVPWYVNKSFSDKSTFILSAKKLLTQLKNLKHNHSPTSDLLQYKKSCIKKN